MRSLSILQLTLLLFAATACSPKNEGRSDSTRTIAPPWDSLGGASGSGEPCTQAVERPSERACGWNARGRLIEHCQSEEWLLSGGCQDPDECVDGTLLPADSTCPGEEIGLSLCVDGHWSTPECQISQSTTECVEGAVRRDISCGLNGRGKLQESCQSGVWTTTGQCEDPDHCVDGERRQTAESCGWQDSGVVERICHGGQLWPGQCVGANECLEHAMRPGPKCPQGGRSLLRCQGGILEEVRACGECGGKVIQSNLFLKSNEEVEALAGVTHLAGLVELSDEVSSLKGLENLQCVYELRIRGTQLKDLEGLSKLHSAHRLYVVENQELLGLGSLPALEFLDDLSLRDNPKMLDVGRFDAAFDRVEFADNGSLSTIDRGAPYVGRLLDLEGLPSLTELETLRGAELGALYLTDLPEIPLAPLETIQGLDTLHLRELPHASLAGVLPPHPTSLDRLILVELEATDFSALAGLKRVKRLELRQLKLTDLSPLRALAQLERFSVSENPLLTSLKGLEALEEIDYFYLRKNPALIDAAGLSPNIRFGDVSIINSAFQKLNFPRGPTHLRSLKLSNNDELVSFSWPGLTTVTGGLWISYNDQLSEFLVAQLTSLASATFKGNPELAACRLEELREQVTSEAPSSLGGWENASNNDEAVCE